MYLDKLYTRLYSDENWNGLSQLLNEIKLFARKDYEGLTESEVNKLRDERDNLAYEMAYRRRRGNLPITKDEAYWAVNKMNTPSDSITGAVIDAFSPKSMDKLRNELSAEYRNNLDDYLNEITDTSNKLRDDAVREHNDKILNKYQESYNESHPLPELNVFQKLYKKMNSNYEPSSWKLAKEYGYRWSKDKASKDPGTIKGESDKRFRDKPSYLN